MGAADARFVVGIDLGTTHTVVAYAPIDAAEPTIFPIPQLVTATSSAPRPLLPSLLYAPLPDESLTDPWGAPPWVKGEVARLRGVEVPGRLVTSAKSWLSHGAVDRTAPILPWGADTVADARDEDRPADVARPVPRISPCDASSAYLSHVRRAWDEAHPGAPLAAQDVVLTVPASFDEVARELTVAAATAAGLAVRLLEEPLAAFCDYRQREGDGALAELARSAKGGASPLVLVCDVGGGTTDLSLVRVGRGVDGALDVTRVAVGRHLLLGGDNMDLALAHLSEPRLSTPDAPLDPIRFGQLVLTCRAAKEALLSADAPADVGVSVAARGSRLVGGTRSTRLAREEVVATIVEGFFPSVPRDAPAARPRPGLTGFGLPYERDVAITRHVAAFFARHVRPEDGIPAPSALLLNGGVFHAPSLVARLATAVEAWGPGPIPLLPHADPDLAVARGAVLDGLARRGGRRLIRGGASRGYYARVAGSDGAPAFVCVVPRGAEEGAALGVTGGGAVAPLALVVGRPARFDLYASDTARGHAVGEVLAGPASAELDLQALPPVVATFEGAVRGEASVGVALQGELTATGTLDLACVELAPPATRAPRRFRLAWNLRAPHAPAGPSTPPPSGSSASPTSSGPGPARLQAALTAIARVFGKDASSARDAKDLVRELERLLGDRGAWDTPTARALFDALLKGAKQRRGTFDHERVFWQLAGFCVRPGVGDHGDPARVAALFRLLPERLLFPDQVRSWQQLWFAWRRAAAGLTEKEQTALRDLVDPFLAPRGTSSGATPRKLPKWKPDALDAMLEMASSLERVPAARRAELGAWVLERTWTERDPRLWGALGRLGARAPTYASLDHVVATGAVERWLDQLLREKWDQLPTAKEAALRMARVTGDRARDLPERLRGEVARRLRAAGATPEEVRTVEELVEVAEVERDAFFGEGMPAGFRLLA